MNGHDAPGPPILPPAERRARLSSLRAAIPSLRNELRLAEAEERYLRLQEQLGSELGPEPEEESD